MIKTIKTIAAGLLLVPVIALGVSAFTPATETASASIQSGIDGAKGDDVATNLTGDGGIFKIVVNVLLFVIGAVSVVMLIFGGIRYTISGGDSGAVTSAKNTILYAIIGLVVAFLAFAIVNWVLGALGGTTTQ